MAWTTPRTWVTNELVTAAIMNTHVRDQFNMLANLIAGGLSATPPGSPTDGQLWAMNPGYPAVVWVFRYNAGSASAYKWEFVGGPPITNEAPGAKTIATNTYSGADTGVSIPRQGDYIVRQGGVVEAALTSGWRGYISFLGTDADSVWASGSGSAGAASEGAGVHREMRRNALVGPSYALTYKSATGANITFTNTYLSFLPVRVG